MKKLIILSAIAMSGLVYNTANAQIGLHIGLHFGPAHVVYTAAPVVVEQARFTNRLHRFIMIIVMIITIYLM